MDRDDKYKNTRFYYRDLREARITKDLANLSVTDFVILSEEEVFKVEFAKIIQLNILNKYVKTKDIYIYSEPAPNKNVLESLIYFFYWLAGCKKDLIDFYNTNEIENKIQLGNAEWFDGLDILDVIIEIKEIEKICCQISICDYSNHNLGFELEIINDPIISILYNPDL